MASDKALQSGNEARALLYGDLVGSTALVAEAGDLIIRRFINIARSVTAEHKGTIVKVLGDGFFAIFDDVADALSFARDLHRSLSSATTPSGRALPVRISIHFGTVQIVDTSYGVDVRGENSMMVARLNSGAPADGVAISRAAMQRLPAEQRALFRPPEQELKGLPATTEYGVLDLRGR
jgi:class 3 adenylate cyclase